MTEDYDLVVIGAGPGGMTAGIYGARAGLKTIVLEGQICGGQIAEAPDVENFPGMPKIMGMDLSDKIKEHAETMVEIKEMEEVETAEYGEPIKLKVTSGDITAKAVILATGAKHKQLGVENEFKFHGKGISYCATCDGNFFLGKRVAVIGGGNSALMEALYLKNIGCLVSVIHRRDQFRADEVYVEQARCADIEFIMDSVVTDFDGAEMLETVRVKNLKEDIVTDMPFQGAFISVGIIPTNQLAKELGVELDEAGYIITDKEMRTNKRYIYAAGDITGGLKQAIVACGEGAVAAISAYTDVRNPYWCESK
jgi:thioredoxin reductase (NADPH)